MEKKPLYQAKYKHTPDGWVQLTPEAMAALYARPKKEVDENRQCAEYFIELAVEASGMKQANEVLKHIMDKK